MRNNLLRFYATKWVQVLLFPKCTLLRIPSASVLLFYFIAHFSFRHRQQNTTATTMNIYINSSVLCLGSLNFRFFCIVSFPNWSSVNPRSANNFIICSTLHRLKRRQRRTFGFLGNTCSKRYSWELPKQVLEVRFASIYFHILMISFVYHLKPYDFNKHHPQPPQSYQLPLIALSDHLLSQVHHQNIQFQLLSQSKIHLNRQKIMISFASSHVLDYKSISKLSPVIISLSFRPKSPEITPKHLLRIPNYSIIRNLETFHIILVSTCWLIAA